MTTMTNRVLAALLSGALLFGAAACTARVDGDGEGAGAELDVEGEGGEGGEGEGGD